MRRHDFEPGKLVVGIVLLGGCLAYLAAVRGWWHFPSYLILPALAVGFCLAGLVSSLTYAVRRHRARGTDPVERGRVRG
ncbi:hypothetical protein ACIHFE_17625 [Streptomyces sp. NPDC052396]|uniref:hypothetical protein n=1 Tax=Streptomyces sp. NPDC052396 TaxID=3365689 RepID=UPI0037CD72B6